jgi:hypothetical protein
LNLFHSSGIPTISRGPNQFILVSTEDVQFDTKAHTPIWFESVWQDDDGTLLLWYHHEPEGVCAGNTLTRPKIGAAVSTDGGATVRDLGIVLESPYPADCSAKNGFFAGGHGDVSVVLDQQQTYFYIFFTNYGGPGAEQGVAVARVPFEKRYSPAGEAMKYFEGGWEEPGLGGRVTPIFPAAREWEREDADSLWGPSIHWNTYLQEYVVLMNHACCATRWPQEGIYISYNPDLSQPWLWAPPAKLLDKSQIRWAPGYYPQVLGLYKGETDSVAGQVARFYIHGRSDWEIVFTRDASYSQEPPEPTDPDPDPEPGPTDPSGRPL